MPWSTADLVFEAPHLRVRSEASLQVPIAFVVEAETQRRARLGGIKGPAIARFVAEI